MYSFIFIRLFIQTISDPALNTCGGVIGGPTTYLLGGCDASLGGKEGAILKGKWRTSEAACRHARGIDAAVQAYIPSGGARTATQMTQNCRTYRGEEKQLVRLCGPQQYKE